MKEKKLKILLLNKDLYNPIFPARPAIMEIYGKYIPSFGHKVTWLCPGEVKKTTKKKINNVDLYIIPFHFHKKPLIIKIFDLISLSFRQYRLIEKLYQNLNFDIIQARNSVINILVSLIVSKKKNIPFLYQITFTNRDNAFDNEDRNMVNLLFGKLTNILHNKLIKYADFIFPISSLMKKYLVVNHFLDEYKIYPLPMGVDYKTFFPNQNIEDLRKKYNLNNNIVFIYIGTMVKSRKLDLIVKAFHHVKKEIKNAKLLMIGDGSGKGELKEISMALNLGDDVIFTGRVPYSEIPKYISLADIGLCPIVPIFMYKMSSPTKMLEYMACEKPVIGNREIFEISNVISKSGGGILVEFEEKSFSSAMIKLARNSELIKQMGSYGREWIIKNRSYEMMAKKIEEIYYLLINRPYSINSKFKKK